MRVTLVMSRSIFTTFSMLAPVPSLKGRPSELLQGKEERGDDLTGKVKVGLQAVRQPTTGQASIICYQRILKSTVDSIFQKGNDLLLLNYSTFRDQNISCFYSCNDNLKPT